LHATTASTADSRSGASHAAPLVCLHRMRRLHAARPHPRRPVRRGRHRDAALPVMPGRRHSEAQRPAGLVITRARLGVQQAEGERPRISGGDDVPVPWPAAHPLPAAHRSVRSAVHQGQPEDGRPRHGQVARRRGRADTASVQAVQQLGWRGAGTRRHEPDMNAVFRAGSPRDPHPPEKPSPVPSGPVFRRF